MKPGVMLINTSRGGLIDTGAVIDGLKSGRLGHLGLDVYEEEALYFYEDFSSRLIGDDALSRLLTFPNVIVTSHQGFFTREALEQIARTTLANVRDFEQGRRSPNEVRSRPGERNGRGGWRRERELQRRSSRAVTPATVSLPYVDDGLWSVKTARPMRTLPRSRRAAWLARTQAPSQPGLK